jgi:aminopeptidase N
VVAFLHTGLQAYLTKFQYKNTVTTDLWDAWAKSSGEKTLSWLDWNTPVLFSLSLIKNDRHLPRQARDNHREGAEKTDDVSFHTRGFTGEKVAEVMAGWTLQTGYPLVTVEEKVAGTLTLRQERFLSGEEHPDKTIK